MNGSNIKTFLDAKSLVVDIFSSKATAFQIRSYGWSAHVPCAFVSNFAQIREKKYAEPYLADGRPVWLVGLSFDSKTRHLVDYTAVSYGDA